MAHMASRRTTVVLTDEDQRALQRASRAEGVSQSQLIRKGIRSVTSSYRRKVKPLTGWLKLSPRQLRAIANDELGDYER